MLRAGVHIIGRGGETERTKSWFSSETGNWCSKDCQISFILVEPPILELTFAFVIELGVTEMWGGSLGLLEQLMCQLGWSVKQETSADDFFTVLACLQGLLALFLTLTQSRFLERAFLSPSPSLKLTFLCTHVSSSLSITSFFNLCDDASGQMTRQKPSFFFIPDRWVQVPGWNSEFWKRTSGTVQVTQLMKSHSLWLWMWSVFQRW